MNEIKLNLSKFLETELRKRKLSISKVSQETKIPKTTLFEWSEGRSPKLTNKTIEYLERLSDYFGISVLRMLFGNLDKKTGEILFTSTFKDNKTGYRITVEKMEDSR